MMEFYLTQSYATLEEMLNSAEVEVYKEDLQRGTYEKYAIVSRIGNRYDLNGNKIDGFVDNPFYNQEKTVLLSCIVNEVKEEKVLEKTNMKYFEIEKLIDEEVENAVAKLKLQHEQEIAELKAIHEDELATAKANAKAEAKEELLAKLKD